MIKAKQLKWVKVKPEVFEDWSYCAEINVLTLNRKPAYYQVHKVADCVSCGLWVHNSCVDIKSWITLEEGLDACQQHYDSLVRENADGN
jgi:hypothetical protein